MHHLCEYSSVVADDGVNTQVSAVVDGWLPIVNNNFLLPEPMQLRQAFLFGEAITRARLNVPSFRVLGLPYMVPVCPGTTIPTIPAYVDLKDHELNLPLMDEIMLETTNVGGTSARHFGLFWLGDQDHSSVTGPVYTIRGTATITGVTGGWASGTLTLDQTLPGGRYAVVGMDALGTNLVAARLLLPGSVKRPGCLGRVSAAFDNRMTWRYGRIGTFGFFQTIAPPTLDILCLDACTAQEVYLDVVKVA